MVIDKMSNETNKDNQFSDTQLLDWLEKLPIENLQAVEWRISRGKDSNIRESIARYIIIESSDDK